MFSICFLLLEHLRMHYFFIIFCIIQLSKTLDSDWSFVASCHLQERLSDCTLCLIVYQNNISWKCCVCMSVVFKDSFIRAVFYWAGPSHIYSAQIVREDNCDSGYRDSVPKALSRERLNLILIRDLCQATT